uniref:Uncharacterized protein n=1 Tax=Arion vulgaris TaxID=1028688 RepID=A0A0B7B138_9EUPU
MIKDTYYAQNTDWFKSALHGCQIDLFHIFKVHTTFCNTLQNVGYCDQRSIAHHMFTH